MKSYKLDGLDDLLKTLDKFDRAEKRPVAVLNQDVDLEKILDQLRNGLEPDMKITDLIDADLDPTEIKSVINIDNDTISSTTTGYKIVQHEDFFEPAIWALEKIDYDIDTVEVKDYGDSVYAEALFNDTFANDEIQTGVRIGNSFDKSTTAFVEAYGERIVCGNGIINKAVLGRVSQMHRSGIEPKKLAIEIEKELPKAKNRLGELIKNSRSEFLPTKYVKPLIMSINLNKSMAKKIHRDLQPEGSVSKWELYNAVTYKIERKSITERVRERYHRYANDILMEETDDLINQAVEFNDSLKEDERISAVGRSAV